MTETTGESGIEATELYNRVRWSPVNYGGGETRSSTFKKVNDMRFEFQTQWIFKAIIIVAFVAGGGLILSTLYQLASTGSFKVFGVFGFIILMVGFILYRRVGKTAVFDLQQGFYWKGNAKYIHELEKNYEPEDLTPLADVMALQILSERIETEKDGSRYSFNSYELNLVLRTDARINVVDNGGFYNMRHGAEVICEALNVPLLIQKGLH